MAWTGLGIVTSTGVGNLVAITTNQSSANARIGCQAILLQALSNASHTNTGRVYIFDRSSTRIATLAVPSTNTIPSAAVTIPNTEGALNAADYSISAEVSGDGVDASYLRP